MLRQVLLVFVKCKQNIKTNKVMGKDINKKWSHPLKLTRILLSTKTEFNIHHTGNALYVHKI